MEIIAILLLAIGFIPVIVSPFDMKILSDDPIDTIRYKIKLAGIRHCTIARGLGFSVAYISQYLNGSASTRLNAIIKFVKERDARL